MMLGEIRGQLREVIHTMNNQAQKLDAIATLVIEAKSLPGEVAALKVRVATLEAERNQREGAMSLGRWLFRSPLIGWLATAAAVVWALWKDRA